MKKSYYSALPLFFIFLLSTIVHSQEKHRLIVKVLSADRMEPIEGASVTIELKTIAFTDRKMENSDWEGLVYREYEAYGTFTINAEAPGFYGSIRQVVVGRKDPSGDLPVTIILKRKQGVKLVIVEVFEEGSGASLYDAKINLKGNNYSFNGSTNGLGQAVIAVDHGDDYVVTVSHNGYKSATQNVRVKEFDDEVKEYNMSFNLEAINISRRTMNVKVQTRRNPDQNDGEMWGVPWADVTFIYESTVLQHNTDEEGKCQFSHSIPPGEQVRIDVKKQNYKPASRIIFIKSSGVGDKANDGVVFTLEKEKDKKLVHINIEVLDHETDQPVPNANVELNVSGGAVEKGNTNAKGEVRFSNMNYNEEGKSAKVVVTKAGYQEKWSDITSDLLSGMDNSERQFVVYLSKKEETADWNGAFKDNYSTFNFSGGNGSVSAQWTYTVSDSKGTGSLQSNKVEGLTATGTWKVQHQDDTKSGARSGTFTLTLSGNVISGQLLEDTPIWNYKTGYNASNVNSSMKKGAVWPVSITRKN